MKHILKIGGMGCQHCVNKVIKALTKAGATVLECEVGKATVDFNGDINVLKTAIENAGYDVTGTIKG